MVELIDFGTKDCYLTIISFFLFFHFIFLAEILHHILSSADFPFYTLNISVSSFFNYMHLVTGSGLDILANTKRGGPRDEGAFRVPRERVASVAASLDEDEEKSASSGLDEVGNVVSNGARNYANRRYREPASTVESNSGTFLCFILYKYLRQSIADSICLYRHINLNT